MKNKEKLKKKILGVKGLHGGGPGPATSDWRQGRPTHAESVSWGQIPLHNGTEIYNVTEFTNVHSKHAFVQELVRLIDHREQSG